MKNEFPSLPFVSKPMGISNEDYHNGEQYKEFISSTVLKQIAHSPLWLKYSQEHPEDIEPTKEWKLRGGCYHAMLSSIVNTGGLDEFEKSTAIFDAPVNPSTGSPYGNTTNKYVEAFNDFAGQNEGKEIYSQKDVNLATQMVEVLRYKNHHLSPMINKIIKYGQAEVSCFIEHKANDLIQAEHGKFKWRKDVTTSNKIVDWKSVKMHEQNPNQFARVIIDRAYDFSAAFYQYFEWMLTGKWKTFYWVAQTFEPPYDFNIITANNWAFNVENGKVLGYGQGALRFLKSLEQYLYCLEKDEFHGVSLFTKPDYLNQRIAVSPSPGYYKSQIFEFFN